MTTAELYAVACKNYMLLILLKVSWVVKVPVREPPQIN